jgi:hypothetical protein
LHDGFSLSQRLNFIRHQHDGSRRRNVTGMNAQMKAIGYWASTAILTFSTLSGGAAQLLHQRQTMDGILQLGYPVYFTTIPGFWKVAGAFFEMTGAAASHAASHSPAWHTTVTLRFAVLVVVSWALRPQTRTMGSLLPGEATE